MRRRLAAASLAVLAVAGLAACNDDTAKDKSTITDSGLVLEEGELPPITPP